MSKMIYLDHAATTKLLPEAAKAMQPYQEVYYGNPSTIYEFGEKSRAAIENARRQIALSIHARPEEIFFTSGGTESDNWALKEAAELYERKHKGSRPCILTTPIEHHAILNTCAELESRNCDTEYLSVDDKGRVNIEEAEEKIKESTAIVSIMYANNEIGIIEPIQKITEITTSRHVIFHTDAVQAYGHLPIDVRKENIDMLSASAHKFGGPKGVGFLFIRKEVELPAFIQGGAQENHRRAGTENVAGIVGMGAAAEISCRKMYAENRRIRWLRDYFIKRVQREIEQVIVTGSTENRLSNNASFCFYGIKGETAAILLDTQGICVSSGSACSTGSAENSHVLKAIGVEDEWAKGALRFTLGGENTKEELDYTVEKLKYVIRDLRAENAE